MSHNGRKAKTICWPDTDDEKGRILDAENGLELVWHKEPGATSWILVQRDGKEIARDNTRFLEAIRWAEDYQ